MVTKNKLIMNDLVLNKETMSSLQIAEITGKNHAHVMRDVRSLLEQGVSESNFGLSSYKQSQPNGGQNRLFEWMRKNGYLCNSGEYYNQPTQRAMSLGLFDIKKTTITKPDGTILINTTPKVTGKGQIYFVNKFLYNHLKGGNNE